MTDLAIETDGLTNRFAVGVTILTLHWLFDVALALMNVAFAPSSSSMPAARHPQMQ
jgi:hypothetical protein